MAGLGELLGGTWLRTKSANQEVMVVTKGIILSLAQYRTSAQPGSSVGLWWCLLPVKMETETDRLVSLKIQWHFSVERAC